MSSPEESDAASSDSSTQVHEPEFIKLNHRYRVSVNGDIEICFDSENLHTELEENLPPPDPKSQPFKVDRRMLQYFPETGTYTEKQEPRAKRVKLTHMGLSANVLNLLLVAARNGLTQLLRSFVSTASPVEFKQFVSDLASDPKLQVTTTLVRRALQATLQVCGKKEGEEVINCAASYGMVLKRLGFYCGFEVCVCEKCLVFYKVRLEGLEHVDLVEAAQSGELPLHKKTCKLCYTDGALTTQGRPNPNGFVSLFEKKHLTLVALRDILKQAYYLDKVNVSEMQFECVAALFFYKDEFGMEREVVVIIPESGRAEDFGVIDPREPCAPLPSSKVDEIPPGYVEGFFFVRLH